MCPKGQFYLSAEKNRNRRLISAVFATAGQYIGAGLALKNGSKIVRPVILVVLVLLTGKVLLEFFGIA